MATRHRPSPHEQLTSAETPATMRAVVQDRYGGPDVLAVADVPRPVAGEGEVLVRVEAASVNARDWHIMRGEPRVARLMGRSIFGWRAPKVRVRGTDYAGVIEAVGPQVQDWAVGDRVFGEASATLAEFVAAPVTAMARIPNGVTMEQAAAVPLAATTAWECLRAANAAPNARTLIVGASGGVGTFLIQLARSLGLHVTAVCSARNAEQARALGASKVIDYAQEDFTQLEAAYDLVIDLVGNRPLAELQRVATPAGSVVLSGGRVPGEGRIVGAVALLIRAQVARRRGGPLLHTPQAVPTHGSLEVLADLMRAGVLRAQIERTFDLEGAATALEHLETEHARAKVLVVCRR
ncbi:NAD(P)-dependent alcohol dehydrogenase [Nocardioides sp.]|uniref:NAD(P)-dependent alcohol dehydrogenase n=1 Tax=Nocardioides sp. TaxID=35761 RepID=UPI0035B0AFE2